MVKISAPYHFQAAALTETWHTLFKIFCLILLWVLVRIMLLYVFQVSAHFWRIDDRVLPGEKYGCMMDEEVLFPQDIL